MNFTHFYSHRLKTTVDPNLHNTNSPLNLLFLLSSMTPKQLSNYEEGNKPCFRCFKTDHSRTSKCPNKGIISCSSCFRLNVFTNYCNCKNKKRHEPPQVLRIVGNQNFHKWYTDLHVQNEIIPARLNPSIVRTRVSHKFADWLQSKSETSIYRDVSTIMLKTVRKGSIIRIPCDVIPSQEEYIELGMEVMMTLGYSLTLEGISIHSNNSPVMASPYETDYVYNNHPLGEDLRRYLNQTKFFLKRGRTIKTNLHSSTITVTIRRQNNPASRSSSLN